MLGYRERFREPYWNIQTPEHKKLNDEDVHRFVVSMQSIAMSAIFSPVVFTEFTSIFQELATLRPDIVIPPLLDKYVCNVKSSCLICEIELDISFDFNASLGCMQLSIALRNRIN